ncbi:MAG: hypothetical protein QM734_17180 [Cyclobacteriaceae bacterium]
MRKLLLVLFLAGAFCAVAQDQKPEQKDAIQWKGKFEQLDQMLPTPNEYRTGSGAPGPKYWQQQADYEITAELNDANQTITGSETITYSNNSPDGLKYLWLQLDQNIFDKDNNTSKSSTGALRDSSATKQIAGQVGAFDLDGGYKIKSVKDATGKDLKYTINKTMMRIDLPQTLKAGGKYTFKVEWSYNVLDRNIAGGRSGYEFFPDDNNYVYTIAQWFPRMCVYDDVVGWQNKQFLGRGEFALAFGNYKVNITVPADHIIGATGTVKNPQQVLTAAQLARYEKAKTTYDKPVIICTQDEAIVRENKVKREENLGF